MRRTSSIVQSIRVGPADDPEGRIRAERLAQDLDAAQVKLARQQKAATATEKRIAELRREVDASAGSEE
jgi:hypothetical protein